MLRLVASLRRMVGVGWLGCRGRRGRCERCCGRADGGGCAVGLAVNVHHGLRVAHWVSRWRCERCCGCWHVCNVGGVGWLRRRWHRGRRRRCWLCRAVLWPLVGMDVVGVVGGADGVGCGTNVGVVGGADGVGGAGWACR